ncbi:hypothetical protein A2Z56_02435 [Candidatus Kaiserbacteria bacterium RIFCSPHIGHO2_12_45_16]|nr:MAG: hypothetical protein A2Z56_02435 [Candidatus Kaiserbacteria bacterium RIFCSPHIGHO2_12_45_16]
MQPTNTEEDKGNAPVPPINPAEQQTVPPPAPEQMNDEVAKPAPAAPVVNNIASRLEKESVTATVDNTDKPVHNTPMMIDLANLSTEQLSMLKSMLSVTPDRVQQKRGNIQIEIRRVNIQDEPRYVVDIKRARMALEYHAETGAEVEAHVISVLLNGATEYVDMNYTEFMQSDRVKVEVISTRTVEGVIEEGEVISRETGKLVMKELKTVQYFYTVKLPDGTTVELEGKMANA